MSKVRIMIGAWLLKLRAENREKIGLETSGLRNLTAGVHFRIMMAWET